MKKNFILSLLFVGLAAFTANAQTDGSSKSQFQPGWYMGMYAGGTGFFGDTGHNFSLKNQTVNGNVNWGPLHYGGLTTNFTVGYDFTSVFGLRFDLGGGLNRWKESRVREYKIRHMYDLHLTGDLMVNLSNAIGGYNPDRVFDLSIFVGVGVADRMRMNNYSNALITPVLRGGLEGTFHLTHAFDFNIDLATNWVSDKYNGYKVSFPFDILNTAQIGVAYHFGRSVAKAAAPAPAPAPQIITKYIHDTVYKQVAAAVTPKTVTQKVSVKEFSRDVFFPINKTDINNFFQKRAIADAAAFLKANPSAKLTIDGYADKDTGTKDINWKLSQGRAQNVANTLIKQYGIDPSRLTVTPRGDRPDQPYTPKEANRVTIMKSTAQITTTE